MNDFEAQRKDMATRARVWTEHQARRLEVSPEAIETAIQRGWLPDQIDRVEQAAELLLSPGKAR